MKTKRLLAIFALLCITIVHTHAQVVFNATNFPDANFRQSLKDKYSRYGFTTEGVTISAEQLGSLKELSLYNSGTSNLKGIEHFKNLETLSYHADGYSGNYEEYVSSEIDLSKNTALKSLRLGSIKNVTSLNLSKLTALLQLSLDHLVDLTSLNINNCTNLHLVELAALWALPTLNISNLSNLYFIDLRVLNHLTSLTLPNQSNLFGLQMQNMDALENIDLSKQTKLQIFNDRVTLSSRLKLSSIDFSKNTELRSIYITDYLRGGSILTSINISNLKKLSVFTLRYTSISSLDLSTNSNLKVVDVRNNTLRNIDLSKQTKLGTEDEFVHYSESGSPIIKGGFDPVQYTRSLGIPYWGIGAGSLMDLSGAILDVSGQKCKDELLIQSNTKVAVSYPTTLNPSYVSNMKLDGTAVSFSNESGYHTMTRTFAQINDMLWGNNGTNKPTFTYDYNVKCGTAAYANTKMDVTVETMPFVAVGDNNGGSGNFPDANFRTIAKTFDTHARIYKDVFAGTATRDDRLDYDELKAITNINVANKGIATLQGVEYMKNLQSLNCSYNNLAEASSLPLTYNTELKTLHCHHNQLTALDVSQNTQLEDLRFNNNMVAGTLNLSSHTFLQHLNGSDNQITSFVQPTGGNLVNVYLIRNKLTSLDLSKHLFLEQLRCYAQADKALTTLTLPPTPARLISLQAQDNSLSSIGNFDKATKLTELRLERNLFTSLDVSKMTQLQTFTCYTQGSYQEFTGLHTLKLPATATLATLHIQNNNLAAIDLSKTTNLSDLKLTPQWISEDFIVTTPKTVSTLGSTGNLNGRVQSQMSNYTMNSGSLNNFTKILAALKNFAETGNSNISGSYKYNTKCASTVRPTIKDTLMTVTVKGYPYVAVNNTGNFDEGNGTGNFSTDTKFTDALKSAIGNVVNGRLTPQQIASVKSLDVANKDITIADGFGWFWNLENLNCNTNNLSSLNISFNTGLLTLNCHHNQLADSIDLTNHKLLQNLYCNNNLIPKLVMPDAASLKNVDCYENQLVALDFSKHSTLEKLNCSSQMEDSLFLKLQDLTLPDVPTKLTQLRAYRNSLFEIKNLDKATALQTLIIDNNLFTEVDLTNNTKLKEARVHTQGTYKNFTGLHTLKLPSSTTLTRLDIQNNNLAAVDLSGLTALTTLNINPQWISEDFLVTKPQKVEALGMTQELNGRVDSRMSEYTMNPDVNMGKLSGFENIMNALKKVAAAGSGGATGSYKYDTKCASTVRPTLKDTLMTVTIRSNLLVEVNNTGNFTKGTGAGNFTTDTKFTDELKTAIRNVKNNRLSAGQIASVKGLDLKKKGLTVADGFGWFWNLQRLNIGKNTSLSELDVTMNNELSRLICDSCALTRVDASKNTKLEYLQCRYNPLTSVDVKNSPDLGFFDCSYTYTLTELDITNNPKLYRLACGNNKLKKLEVGHLTLLEDLTCGHNWFTETSKLDLTHSPLLFNLSCPQNNLVELDVSQNPLLLHISCYENKIAALDLSQNAVLDSLNCSKNQIAALDLNNNTALTRLHCQENHLRTLDLSQHENLIRLNCNDQTSEEDITVFEFDKIGIYLPTGGKKENFLNMVVAGQNRAANIYSNGEQYLVVNPTPTADIDMYDKSVTYRYNTECATPEFANHVMENVVITTWPYVMYVNPNSQSIAGNFYSGTIVLDYDAVVPAGTETYIVKGLKATPRQMLYNGTMYSLQQLDMQRIATAGEVIPANTPVYVKSNTQTGLHAFSRNLTDATPVSVPSGNLLKGSPTSDITVEPYSILTLGREKTTREVGFWQYSGTKSAAHRCYLDASVLNGAVISTTSGSSKGAIFCFDDEDFGETTGIDTGLNGNEQNDTWHTLSGIRLNGKPTKSGIYIHNGRKEVIK